MIARRELLIGSGPHGLPELVLTGLDEQESLGLLTALRHEVAVPVAIELFRATAGNPPALEVSSRSLTPGQLRGAEPLPPLLPGAEAIELAYGRALETLEAEARRALLVAAATETDDMGVLTAALEVSGIAPQALEATREFVRLRVGSIEFTHPLARSAIYEAASPRDRRTAHRALTEAYVDAADADRRVWHLALGVRRPGRGDRGGARADSPAGDPAWWCQQEPNSEPLSGSGSGASGWVRAGGAGETGTVGHESACGRARWRGVAELAARSRRR